MERDKASMKQVMQRIKNQMDEEAKRKLADYILINDGSMLLVPQVLNFHNKIMNDKI